MGERNESQWTDLLQPLVVCEKSLLTALQQEIEGLEELLQTAGDDMQMWQNHVQNRTQEMTQMLTLMTQLLKLFHDAAMNIVRNLKG